MGSRTAFGGIIPATLATAVAIVAGGTLVAGSHGPLVAAAGAVVAGVVAFHRTLFSWRSLLATLLLIILFIPIRRYTLGGTGHFQLEPYRLLVAFIIVGWLVSLLVDRRLHIRRSGFEWPLGLIMFSTLGSIATNVGSIEALGVRSDVIKSTLFFASFFFVFYVIRTGAPTLPDVDFLVKTLVCGGTVVAVAAIYEARTGFNVFNHLTRVAPFLQAHVVPDRLGDITGFQRGGKDRVYASAEHPIALGAALVMLLPLALYLARKTGQRRWLLCSIVLAVGTVGTVSRTGVLMLFTMGLVFLWLRPRETIRFWPALLLMLLAVHFVMPHTLGILKSSFFPTGGLVAEQSSDPGSTRVQGRVAKIRPTLNLIKKDPLFGVGFGSQIVYGPRANALILDDQWLGTLRETGFVGLIAWIWLVARLVRRGAREAKEDHSPRGLLLVAMTASLAACSVGMLTFDALGFIQVSFLFFTILALMAVVLKPAPPRLPRQP